MTTTEIIIFGCCGGMIPDLLRLIKNKYKKELPQYLKSANFYIGFILQVIFGGITAFLLQATSLQQALAFGYSAPELLTRALAKHTKEETRYHDRGSEDSESPLAALRKWWSR